MAVSDPTSIREFLDEAKVSASDRTEFLSSLRDFLTNDQAGLAAPTDPAQLTVWGEVLNQVASYLFASARDLTPKSPPKKAYPLTLSEVELWLELQNSKSKSGIGADGLPPLSSSEVFRVDHITDAEEPDK
jgi:hypothetical protein